MKYGKKLKFGDTIGLIAPSGAVRTEGAVVRAVEETKRMGFKVKLGPVMVSPWRKLCQVPEMPYRVTLWGSSNRFASTNISSSSSL